MRCRQAHLPLEYGYARALLERAGHETLLLDAHLHDLLPADVVARLTAFHPDRLVVTTASSSLFWRCAPPELRLPRELLEACRGVSGLRVVVGPHASTTPGAVLEQLDADAVVMGEDILPQLAAAPMWWAGVASIACRTADGVRVQGSSHTCDMRAMPLRRRCDGVAPGRAGCVSIDGGERLAVHPLLQVLEHP